MKTALLASLIAGMSFVHATPLIDAAHQDDVEKVRKLIQGGADVKASNRYGVGALSLACQNGNSEIVEILLKEGADPNAALTGKETALMTAARTGDLSCVQLLVNAGAKLDAKEHRGQTALMWASAEGNTAVVEFLLEEGAEFRTPLKSGFTPFLFAVRQGHIEVVKAFLKAGVDVNEAAMPERAGRGKRMRAGTSSLMLAMENGHFELGVVLLNAGADPNDQRTDFAPLHALTWVRKPVKGDGDDGLPSPRGSGNRGSLEFVRELVKHGADVNLALEKGWGGTARVHFKGATPFLLASQTGDLPYLKLLLELGADPTIANVEETPPLLAAAGLGVLAPGEEAASADAAIGVVKLLIELGADINVKDKRGETVMHAAAYKSSPKLMELLDELGADIKLWNQKNKAGLTPLRITQGYRPGNFRPIETSELALSAVMRKHGVEPIPDSPSK